MALPPPASYFDITYYNVMESIFTNSSCITAKSAEVLLSGSCDHVGDKDMDISKCCSKISELYNITFNVCKDNVILTCIEDMITVEKNHNDFLIILYIFIGIFILGFIIVFCGYITKQKNTTREYEQL